MHVLLSSLAQNTNFDGGERGQKSVACGVEGGADEQIFDANQQDKAPVEAAKNWAGTGLPHLQVDGALPSAGASTEAAGLRGHVTPANRTRRETQVRQADRARGAQR